MFAAFGSCGIDSGTQWKNWGGILANTHPTSDEAVIIVDAEKTSSSPGISGTLKLIRDVSRHGLLIEVQCHSPTKSEFPCEKKTLTIITPTFKEYNFTLQLPNDQFLSRQTAPHPDKVAYWLRLYKEVDSIYALLFEERFEISWRNHSRAGNSVEEQISVSGLQLGIKLPQREFAPGQNIHFTLKLVNPSKGSVKKVTLILWNMVKHAEAEGQDDEAGGALVSNVLGTLLFNKFPKGESTQEGFFDVEKLSGTDKSRSKYVIQVNVRTTNNETFSTQLDLNIVDPDTVRSEESVPFSEIEQRPSAPREINAEAVPPSAPPEENAEGLLSLPPPPGYSLLSSRASSTLSLETLPPHYEDVWY